MATTTYAGIRYPIGGDATTIATYYQNLATDVDQKVITRVADNTSRNAQNKYDGMLTFVTSTRRLFRYSSSSARWDYLAGPWYTWTPDLIGTNGAGSAVTADTYTRTGEYVIREGYLDFHADLRLQGAINGQSGALVLQMPTGVVAKSTEPEQHGIKAELFTPITNRTWVGGGYAVVGGQQVGILMPTSTSDCSMQPFRNATGAGVTGSGVPLISGSYPLADGARVSVWGRYKLSSWPAL